MASINLTGLSAAGARVSVAGAVVGLEKSLALLAGFGRSALSAAGAELFIEHEAIVTTAKKDFVPVDEGTLRASGFTELPKHSQREISVDGGFGGAAAPYALIQHENPDFRHTVGTYKYYEKPLLAAVAGMDDRIAAGMKRRLLS